MTKIQAQKALLLTDHTKNTNAPKIASQEVIGLFVKHYILVSPGDSAIGLQLAQVGLKNYVYYLSVYVIIYIHT